MHMKIEIEKQEIIEIINELTKKLIYLLKNNDPMQILMKISMLEVFLKSKRYSQNQNNKNLNAIQTVGQFIEFCQSIILGINYFIIKGILKEETFKEIYDLIKEIYKQVDIYSKLEYTTSLKNKNYTKKYQQEVQSELFSRLLYVRGDSIHEHSIELMQRLFQPHDNFLLKKIGLISNQILEKILEIGNQVTQNIINNSIIYGKIFELRPLISEFLNKDEFYFISKFDEIKELLINKNQDLKELLNKFSKNPFLIEPKDNIQKTLLKHLNAECGDNIGFINNIKYPGWPTNKSIIYTKPILKFDNNFYCFLPSMLIDNIRVILEQLIRNYDQNYFKKNYLTKRGKVLEQLTLEYFTNILINAKSYEKLYYYMDVNGNVERYETDGIILYDNNIFILEAKSGKFPLEAQRGGFFSIRKTVKNLIEDAYKQAIRTKNYILFNETSTFEDENGSIILIIDNKEIYKNLFLINTTLELLGPLSTRLNSIKAFDVLKGKEWVWSVFINDLRIISDLIETPSEFLLYLQRRLKANDYVQLQISDEMNFLQFFLKRGLYLEGEEEIKNADFVFMTLDNEINQYYDFLAGRAPKVDKPAFFIPKAYRYFIKQIESTQKYGFTEVTTFLLGISSIDHQKILKWIEDRRQKTLLEGKLKNFTLGYNDIKLGITFFTFIEKTTTIKQEIDEYINLKIYQTRYERWFVIMIKVESLGIKEVDFEIIVKKWKFDIFKNKKVRNLENLGKLKYLERTKKIGRNEPCPCGSGIKFKKCCGKK